MRKKILTAMVVVGALALGACQEDPTLDELIAETELNQTTDPGDNENEDPDPPGGGQ